MAVGDRQVLLGVKGLHKQYAAPVLRAVDFEVRGGEVHALLGANGAGKTTLAHIIAGLTPPNSGRLTLRGQPYAPANKSDSERQGVHIVQQELNLIGTLSVAENLFLNRLNSRFGFVDYATLNRRARQALDRVGLVDVDPATPVARLGVGKQQLVEIAAALSRPCRVLILDEPTAALTDPQIDLLFEHIGRLRASGVGVVYISHRLEEIRRLADRATVLRDGRVVGTEAAASMTLDRIVRLMVGREVGQDSQRHARRLGAVAMRVERLCRGPLVRDVSFDVRHGEILGIAGLVGSGRTELVRAVFGADRAESGAVYLPPSEAPRRFSQPREAVKAGLAMVPEDRKQHGLFLPQPIRVNVTLGKLAELARPRGWIADRRERAVAERYSDMMEIQRRSIEQSVDQLSGGNQQKVVIARWLMGDAKVLLFDEPTRGIDVAAKATVFRLLSDLAVQGKAVVVVSSDLSELMAVCDRIGVMSAGRMVRTLDRGEWSHEAIMKVAISGYSK